MEQETLVAREGTVAHDRRRRRLYELVCAHGFESGRTKVHLSVPTRFLKSWIQAHYADRVLTCWQAEMPEVHRIDLTVRTAMRCAAPAKEAAVPVEARRVERADGAPRPNCARLRPRRFLPAMMRSAARRSTRA